MTKFFIILMVFYSVSGVAKSQLTDPTKPYHLDETSIVSILEPPMVFYVSSILKRKKTAWAVVNGVKAGVGSQVDGAKVLRILNDQVLLDIGDTQRWVSFSNYSGLKQSR